MPCAQPQAAAFRTTGQYTANGSPESSQSVFLLCRNNPYITDIPQTTASTMLTRRATSKASVVTKGTPQATAAVADERTKSVENFKPESVGEVPHGINDGDHNTSRNPH
ncbi:MAG TPA: hypothetical protein VGK48_10465 [Terriglobia bacterium]